MPGLLFYTEPSNPLRLLELKILQEGNRALTQSWHPQADRGRSAMSRGVRTRSYGDVLPNPSMLIWGST